MCEPVHAAFVFLMIGLVNAQSCSVYEARNTARQLATNPINSRQNINLGMILPVHRPDVTSGAVCGPLSSRDMINIEAFFWALRTFGTRWADYSTSSQHGIVFDSCNSADKLYTQLKSIEDGNPPSVPETVNVLGYLVMETESVTVRTNKLLGPKNATILDVSINAAGAPVANNGNFYNLSPSPSQEAKALLQLLSGSGWDYVQILYTDDGYGKSVYNSFLSMSNDEYDVTVGHSVGIPINGNTPTFDLYPPIIVVIAYAEQKLKIIRDLGNKNMIIVTTNIGDGAKEMDLSAINSEVIELRSSMTPIYKTATTEFSNYLAKLTSAGRSGTTNPWYPDFWESLHKCYIRDSSKPVYSSPCNASEQLGNSVTVHAESVSVVIQGTDLMVKALSLACPGASCPTDTLSNQRNAFNRQFRTLVFERERVFKTDTRGPVTWSYDVIMYSLDASTQRLVPQEVGYVRGNAISVGKLSGISLNRLVTGSTSQIVLRSTGLQHEQERNRFTEWGYVWIIAIAVLAGIGIILVFILAILFCVLKKRGYMSTYLWLYAILLFGAFIGYMTLFAYIPLPTKATCGIIRFGVGISYGICFSVMVVLGLILCKRTEMFPSTDVPTIFIATSLVLLISIELVILITWLIFTPPGVAYVLYPGLSGPRQICNHFTLGIGNTFLRTPFENHLLTLIYIMLLILLVLVLAVIIFIRRKYLPARGDKRESYALLAAGIGTGIGTIAIWLTWTLVGGLAGGTYYSVHNYGDAAIAFGLWFTLTWLLIFLLVQIIFAWRDTKLKRIKREVKTSMNLHNQQNMTKEQEFKESLTTVDARVSRQEADSLKKEPLILQQNGGNSYSSYEQHVETRTENKIHQRPAPVPEHHEFVEEHRHVYATGSNYCAECGYAHDPTALRLVHPRSEHSSHNTSMEYNVQNLKTHEVMHEPRLAASLQALHLLHPKSRPVSRAGSLDRGHKRVISHHNTRVARSEIGSTHNVHHYAPNIIDLRKPRQYDRARYYPSNYNNNVYFTEYGSKGASVI